MSFNKLAKAQAPKLSPTKTWQGLGDGPAWVSMPKRCANSVVLHDILCTMNVFSLWTTISTILAIIFGENCIEVKI
jgi:hypothetical protein